MVLILNKTKSLFSNNKQVWRKVLKCAIAYEIATIFLLIPQVLKIFIHVPYILVLATLFFNAAGTTGGQISELLLNLVVLIPAAIFCSIITYCITVYNGHLETNPSSGLYSNGAAIIASLAFFICVFCISYCRVKYPRLFMAALQSMPLPFFCFTRDIYVTKFDVMMPAGIVYPLIIGCGIALVVNHCLWPETAAKASETTFGNSLVALRQTLTQCMDEEGGQKTLAKLQTTIDAMCKAQREAKYEAVISYYAPAWYKPLRLSMARLANHVYGMTLALERANRISNQHRIQTQTSAIHDGSLPQQQYERTYNNNDWTLVADEKMQKMKPTYQHIDRLHGSIKPAMQEFLDRCIHAIDRLQNSMAQHQVIPKSFSSTTSASSLNNEQDSTATSAQQEEHVFLLENALETLNERMQMILHEEFEHEMPMEEHFLIYTILSTLIAFAKELIVLKECSQALIEKKNTFCHHWPRLFWPQVSFKKWLSRAPPGNQSMEEQVMLDQRAKEFKQEQQQEHQKDEEQHDPYQVRRHNYRYQQKEKQSPLQHAPGRFFWNRWLYRASKFLQYGPTRYALKFTVTAEILALMAWLPIPGVNFLYDNNHGQWALLSAMVVSNMTIGATALQCLFRIIATVIGAVCGYIILLAGERNVNPYVIAVLVFVFEIPMWYTFLGTSYPRIGMISLLTLAVIVSTGFTDLFNETLIEPLWKRILTAVVAVLVVMAVEQIMWPTWARKLLRDQLSRLFIDTGIQYAQVTSLVCHDNTLSSSYAHTYQQVAITQRALNHQWQESQQLLGLAAAEARLTKGPFPIKEYQHMLDLEKKIVYWIHHVFEAQKMITPTVRKQIVAPMAHYRKEMAAMVYFYLFTLGGSVRTRTALPAMMPTAELARRMLHQEHLMNWQNKYPKLIPDRSNFEAIMHWHTCAAGTIEIILLQEAIAERVITLMGQHDLFHPYPQQVI
ncbi:hypothetical protein BDA99DRAFT_557804 [Phascolomyces articulosus]|uniref:Uncharacterized protein n=1 Tax=Phascolomyces articulosus TaxID=60185 RepID=A0AAD5K4L2_9FUNG|nr:hypothetical protein BDA99DRAFT_557804 [Phascolomyces articulosus]